MERNIHNRLLEILTSGFCDSVQLCFCHDFYGANMCQVHADNMLSN
jgi:hypothetical protein